jgi:hypothetical protein
MPQTLTRTHEIVRIAQVEQADVGVILAVSGGRRVVLPVDHPDREVLSQAAHDCGRSSVPVGLVVGGNGHVVDLSPAQQVRVRSVRPEDSGERLEVAFWGAGALSYLPRDHPEFDRIVEALRRAAGSGEPVWFANRTWPVSDETEVWNAILDVRDTVTP